MNIREISEMKRQTERCIIDALRAFEEASGLKVTCAAAIIYSTKDGMGRTMQSHIVGAHITAEVP